MSKYKSKYNSLVDLIKFVSAILVIFSHSFSLSSNSKDYLARIISNASFGSFAVAIFFSFSGFYVTKSILKDDKKFLFKRIKRIIPELFVVVFFTIVLVGPVFTNLSLSAYFCRRETYLYFTNVLLFPYHNLPGVFKKNIFGSTVNGALWTLSIEFLCYIYIFIIKKIGFLTKKGSIIIFSLLLVFSFISCYIINDLALLNIAMLITIIRPVLVFIFSSLLYFFKDKIEFNSIILFILSIIICFVFKIDFLYNIILIFILPLMLCYLSNSVIIYNKLLSNLGKISYSIYLVGFVVQQSIVSIFGGVMNSYLNFIIAVPVSVLFAVIVYNFTNRIMNLINRSI